MPFTDRAAEKGNFIQHGITSEYALAAPTSFVV
jgi:hypothetical protein